MDNPEFIQAEFHVSWFIIAVVDTDAHQANIKALYSNLESALARIDISTLRLPYYTFLVWI
jgi:hypothetical protein